MSLGLGQNQNNGWTDHGDIAAIDGASVLTLAFWVAGGPVVSAGEWRKGALRLFEMGADRSYQVRHVGNWQLNSDADAVPADVTSWNHFACVYDGSLAAADRITVYKNGTPLTMSGSTPGTTLPSTSPDTLQCGNVNVSGKIGFVRLWSAALTAAEVMQEIHRYWANRRTNLLIDAPYDDGLWAKDYSGAGNHGTPDLANGVPSQEQGPPVGYGGRILVAA